MGLHELIDSDVEWVWRFFAAYNNRSGRAHLVKIPQVRLVRYTPPNYMGAAEAAAWLGVQAERRPVWRAPRTVTLDDLRIRKYCGQTQRARYYINLYDWTSFRMWAIPTRGICKVCHTYAMTLSDKEVVGSAVNLHQHTIAMDRSTDFQTWLQVAKGFRRPYE